MKIWRHVRDHRVTGGRALAAWRCAQAGTRWRPPASFTAGRPPGRFRLTADQPPLPKRGRSSRRVRTWAGCGHLADGQPSCSSRPIRHLAAAGGARPEGALQQVGKQGVAGPEAHAWVRSRTTFVTTDALRAPCLRPASNSALANVCADIVGVLGPHAVRLRFGPPPARCPAHGSLPPGPYEPF
jgi:hypothetical protein